MSPIPAINIYFVNIKEQVLFINSEGIYDDKVGIAQPCHADQF